MSQIDRRLMLGAAGLAGVAALARLAEAGPITPPAGPVTATGKTTQELYDKVAQGLPRIPINQTTCPSAAGHVFNISVSGSYYLTADLIASGGLNGIRIDAPRVVLDLNGFSIVNTAGGLGANGVITVSGEQILVVRNGVLTGWNFAGVGCASTTNLATLCEDLVFKNCLRGIRMPGPIRISRCLARNCSSTGFETMSPNSIVDHCTAEACTGTGFYLNPYCIAESCSANSCYTGFFGNDGSRITNCSATGNRDIGFDLGSAVLIKDSLARSNGTGGGSVLTGIRGGTRCSVVNCVAEASGARGIWLSHSSLVRGCLASGNVSTGIECADGSTIDQCNLSSNGGHGITVTSWGRVTANVIDYHQAAGTAGVRTGGNYNTIEGNQITRCVTGVDMSNTTGNVVLSNRVAGCTSTIGVNGGGNWYPNIAVSGVNAATNPVANIFY